MLLLAANKPPSVEPGGGGPWGGVEKSRLRALLVHGSGVGAHPACGASAPWEAATDAPPQAVVGHGDHPSPVGGVSTPAGLSHRLVLSGGLRTREHLGRWVLAAVGGPACLQFCRVELTVSTCGPGHPDSDMQILSRTRDVAFPDGFT